MKYWPLLLLLAMPVFADSTLTPEDFVSGLPLIPETAAPAYEIQLPEAVYRGVIRPDLGDIRVFNAAGEVIAHALYQTSAQTEVSRIDLPFFPLDPAAGNSGKLDIHVQQESEQAAVDIEIDHANSNPGIWRFLIDAQAVQRPITEFELSWESVNKGFMYQASIEYGADLNNWNPLVKGAGIADLTFGDNRLQRRHISFKPTKSRYFRLTLRQAKEAPQLTRISAELSAESLASELVWTPVTITQNDADSIGDYPFANPGLMNVRRIRVNLPQVNTLVQATLLSRASEDAPWQTRGQGLLYRLALDDTVLINDGLTVTTSQDRYWLLRIDQSGGGLGSGRPEVALGWYPHTLVFIARGAGPFMLAYGSARAQPVATDANSLLNRINLENSARLVSHSLTIGPVVQLGGAQSLEPPAKSLQWRQLLLWTALIVAVALLIWMAQRLLRDLKTNP